MSFRSDPMKPKAARPKLHTQTSGSSGAGGRSGARTAPHRRAATRDPRCWLLSPSSGCPRQMEKLTLAANCLLGCLPGSCSWHFLFLFYLIFLSFSPQRGHQAPLSITHPPPQGCPVPVPARCPPPPGERRRGRAGTCPSSAGLSPAPVAAATVAVTRAPPAGPAAPPARPRCGSKRGGHRGQLPASCPSPRGRCRGDLSTEWGKDLSENQCTPRA